MTSEKKKKKKMIVNFNIGILGHVDSGKTTLARMLSSVASTAAFDKNPQSKERGITLDLGFSALSIPAPQHLRAECPQELQLTFVDCPGHASLIRTIIGGAQIIDLMLLVIDVQKGIQTQTAECIVIGELLRRRLIVVVNKIDLLDEKKRDSQVAKVSEKLRKTLARTAFGGDVPLLSISAQCGLNIQELIDTISAQVFLPKRNTAAPLLMYVDHCFFIKGQGTVCTGTIIQGQVAVNDSVEIPLIGEQRKVKSIQVFRRSVQSAAMGDRVGLCVTQFNAKLLERGVLTQPGYLQPVHAACIRVERINYYKAAIKSKSKMHISVGFDTVMAGVTLFRGGGVGNKVFDPSQEYEYVEQLDIASRTEPGSEEPLESAVFALLEFESPILAVTNATLIASKLDMDAHNNCCRLAFWGQIQWSTRSNSYADEHLSNWKIFKRKQKQGSVQRVVSSHQAVVQNLFKKEGNRELYVGKTVALSTGEVGVIESTFGTTSKVKVNFASGLNTETMNLLSNGRSGDVAVLLNFKKYIFNKRLGIIQ